MIGGAAAADIDADRPVPAAGGNGPFDPHRIERILVEESLLSQEQLGRALRIQSRLEDKKPLATLVVELGFATRAGVEAALKRRRKELSIEEILVEKGLLTLDQLSTAQEEVRGQPGRRVTRHLVDTGVVSERDYLEACCERHELPFIEAAPSLVDPDAFKKVSLQYLTRHRVVPLSMQDGRMTVIVDDPENARVLADLKRSFGCPVSIALSTRANIDRTLAALSRPTEDGVDEESAVGSIQYHRIEADVSGDDVTNIVDHLFVKAVATGASDMHLEPMAAKLRVRFRIDGGLVHVTDYPASYAARIISRLKVLAQADVAEHRIHQDGKIYLRNGESEVDCRASFYVTVHGENAVIRILRKEQALIGLEQLGFAPTMLRTFLEDVIEPTTGIVLVTGPTGSGKTTTLYAAVDRLNDDTRKIITCEDPVEYLMPGITQCSVANRPGINFVDSLKAIVRQDPDVILIGEIRDPDSASMAIQSALTGHKVLSTFHTEDTVGALLRLVDMNIETFLIASTVTGILSQRLVRRLCRECKVEYAPAPRELRALGLTREELAGFTVSRGRGCPRCLHTGFRGRVGVHELLVMTDPLRDAILQKRPSHELRQVALEAPSFLHLQEDGVMKALRGETTLTEIVENTPRTQAMRPLRRLMEMNE